MIPKITESEASKALMVSADLVAHHWKIRPAEDGSEAFLSMWRAHLRTLEDDLIAAAHRLNEVRAFPQGHRP